MNRKVLCVDDEENVLRAFERNLRLHCEIETAVGPAAGLAAVTERGPYAVVISDLRMPDMNGIQFLAAVRKQSPDSVGMILSGNADLQAAMAAVNEGCVFRFLNKPCPVDTLRGSIDTALKQYELAVAERNLLEHTLNGSVAMMIDVLSVVSPQAFSRAQRVRRYVRHMATQLELTDLWQFDLAAMLSQIGCVTVPSDYLEKLNVGERLNEEEYKTFASHPSTGQKLLTRIPRLEVIADIVGYQMTPFRELRNLKLPDGVKLGAQMLMVAIHMDQTICGGASPESAWKFMTDRPEMYQPELTAAIRSLDVGNVKMQERTIRLSELKPRMILNENLRAANGLLLVAKGQAVSEAIILKLQNFSTFAGLSQSFRVLVPVSHPEVVEPVPSVAFREGGA